MFHVYVLRSERTGRRYVGSCEDFEDRFRRHNAGESKASKYGAPWILLHKESFATRSDAMMKERYYKSGRGRDELDRLPTDIGCRGRSRQTAAA
jgi:putative endonuclease